MFKELLAATTISTNLDEAVEIGKPCLDRLVCLYRGYTSAMACSVGANEMDHFDIAEIIENSGKLGQDDLNTVEDREDFSSKYHERDIMTEQIKYAMMKVMCCINLKEFEGAEKEHGSFLRFKHISGLYLNKKVIYMHSGCGDMTKCCNVYDVVVMKDFDLWQLMTKRLAFNRWDDVDSELIVKLKCDGWKLVVSDNEYSLFVDSKSVCKLHLPWQFMLCAIFIAENKSRIVLTGDGGTLFFKKAIEHMDASAFSLVWQSLSHPLDKFSKEFLLVTNYKMQCLAINSFPYFNIGAHGRMTTDSENSEVHIQLPDDMNTTTKVAKQKKIDPKMNTLVFADYLLFPFDPGGIISLRTRKFLKGRVMLQEIWVSAEIGSKVS